MRISCCGFSIHMCFSFSYVKHYIRSKNVGPLPCKRQAKFVVIRLQKLFGSSSDTENFPYNFKVTMKIVLWQNLKINKLTI